jgi:hypothetical protein
MNLFMPLLVAALAGGAAPADDMDALKAELAALRADLDALRAENAATAAGSTYLGASATGNAPIQNPELSAVVTVQTLLTEQKNDPGRNRIQVPEAELAFQAYVYPGIRTDIIVAFEQGYEREDGHTHVETEVELEEAYVTAANLPWGLDRYFVVQAGRKLIDIGRMNVRHPHHRPFPDTPLPLEHFLGSHNWGDDGVQAALLVPNPFADYDLYVTWTSGLWNGKELHLHDALTSGGPGYGEALLPWDGLIFQQRLYADLPLNEDMDVSVGGSAFWDEYDAAGLYGLDAGYHWQWPGAYRRTTVAGEVMLARSKPFDADSTGFFAYLDQAVTRYVSAGLRGDWSEYADNDDTHAWLIEPYVTYYLNESTYLRASYRYRDLPADEYDHGVFLQFVWGIGPHSHRLSE